MSTHAAAGIVHPVRVDAGAGLPSVTVPVDRAAVTERLMLEFEGQLGLSAVSEVVRDCLRDLADVPPGAQAELVERSARQRLTDRARRTAASGRRCGPTG